MATIEWDLEKLQDIIVKINSVISVLENQKNSLTKLLTQVNGAWSSMAGTEYSNRIDEDLQYISDAITKYCEVRDNLSNAKKAYESSENSIDKKLQSLYSQMSV